MVGSSGNQLRPPKSHFISKTQVWLKEAYYES